MISTPPILEHFYTLQGEGYHQGRAAYFIRLAGCDIKCVWCDVKDSWERNNGEVLIIEDLVKAIKFTNADRVVLTGGEPTLYNLTELCRALKAFHLKIHIETAGVYPLRGQFDWITISPKKRKLPIPQILALAHEFKAVIFHKSDLDWIQQFIDQLNPACHLFLQSEWERRFQNTSLLVDYVKRNPKWRISLQSHKYMAIP